MADIPVEGLLPEEDAGVVGTGGEAATPPPSVQTRCFYINTTEEVIAFQPEVPSGPGGDEEEDDPEETPTTTPRSTQYEVNEDAGQVTMTFIRVNPRPGRSLQFDIVTEPGTALPNLHYIAPESPLLFLEGETFIQRPVTILNTQIGIGISKSFKVRIVAPPSRQIYTRGPTSTAAITILGVGAMGQGFLQFSAPSAAIPETAGTTTVQVTRTGAGVSPGAAAVLVTSTDNTATAPAHYVAVSEVLSWSVADVAPKTVPVSVVNVAGQQGDRTFHLSMSSPSGAQVGTISSQTINILDLTAPVGPTYPLLAGLHIADPHDNTSSAFLDKAALQDWVVIGVLPTRGMPYYEAAAVALKARNPAIKVFLYWDPSVMRTDAGGQNPFTASLIAYFRSQAGVPGLENTWLAQRADGSLVSRALYGTSFYPNFHPNTTADPQGRRAFAYHLDWLKTNILDAAPSADGIYLDNTTHRDAEWAGSWVYQASNLDIGPNDAAKRVSYRAGLKPGFDHWKTITDELLLGNFGGWPLETANVVPAFSEYQVDGLTIEQLFGTNISPFGLRPSGNIIVSNGVGNFASGKAKIDHGLFATQNFRTRAPPYNMFIVSGMPAANRAGAGKTPGYRYARYFMGCCWTETDMHLHGHDEAGGDFKSYEADANVMAQYDEYFGESVSTLNQSQKMAKRKWMGAPTEPKQSTPFQLGCYRRRFQNAEIWMNPEGNGARTLALGAPPAGKVRRLINGSQDPAVNTGAVTGAAYTLSDANGIIFRLDNS